jgi:hypothetical protein
VKTKSAELIESGMREHEDWSFQLK